MKYVLIILSLLTTTSYGQGDLINQREKERLEIEKKSEVEKSKIIVLVKVKGQSELKIVINENWPRDIETTYNILKNEQGQIIYVGEFPISESGDWNLELMHYFSQNGQLIAFEKRLSYFNEECTDGAVDETVIELYDSNFKVIKLTKKQTDNEGKELKVNYCEHGYDWTFEKRPTVKEFANLKKIRV
ncbi:hypothetical protein SanaruYs_08840 [Chryseotalea sanaruensis]|uniref:Uncharacterized protein n=1 Tax=Chryseotalea sanaruensis TaxID=2482724 RepID=A0A401U746_9BACT|nr:hypothetical protein [Chryseotalea sanaruensis]GCC50666.1 hypothetical protein SanaruYs_08840 [Chryseotalea sanaruensis]